MPKSFNFFSLPIPDVCKICGDPIDPADNITSLLAITLINVPFFQ